MCDWLNEPMFCPKNDDAIVFGLLRAVLAHLYLAWIHPFGDGNGRTARLIECQILLSARVPTPAAHLLSNHYNQTRANYYRRLREASESGGDVRHFIEYAVEGFVDGLREHLSVIRAQQWSIAWRDYIHEVYSDSHSVPDKRRRDLVLDLTSFDQPVQPAEIRHVSPRIAEAYAGKGAKTVTRDLDDLIDRGLVERVAGGYRAKKETVLAFLPFRHEYEEP